MSNAAIEVIGLSKRFPVYAERRTSMKEWLVRGRSPGKQYFWALREATFSVPRGSSLGIIGHNGSGKSTALKVLTGIYRPTAGQVKVNGTVAALLEVGAGFHPELTGRENIRLNATILGFTNREISAMLDEIIEFADVGDHIDSPIKHYSSGMYVRLGFAVAVMVRPEILVVDEVIAVGDESFQRKCYDHLHRLRGEGTTMVIVSHGLGQIVDLCDEAIWLDGGEVVKKGSSQAVVSSYLESVNRIEGEHAPVHPAALTEPAVGSEVVGDPRTEALNVTGVDLLGESGELVNLVISGRAATIRLHYRARVRCDRCVLEVTIDDESARTVTLVSTRGGTECVVPLGEGHVDFLLEPLLLNSGDYRIWARALIDGSVADSFEFGVPLRVRSTEVERPGVMVQPASWSIHTSPMLPGANNEGEK